ncbi:hypothetical protein A3709_08000 [Halioglobus sp. HI00S01]|uniref:hypothetical protein n=1 Tax=Halioglobus sp. HI00S01 TaxID=1822214 RepID=UPI0007C23060|nr:hypothetical protein [Halioglobus sp. HI00S01]KZX54943.1 hypothetical protein A3709_08000 [Halioglobus sp. HI00S01]
MTFAKQTLATAIGYAALVASAHSAPFVVTSAADSGPGSLRTALANGATHITIAEGVGDIGISDTLVYEHSDALTIVGNGQTISGGGAGNTLLEITQGANLKISNLSFEDQPAGGWQIMQGGGNGILVSVPVTRQGMVELTLNNVSVSHTGDHGVHVFDCDLADCGAGSGGGGNGSPASVSVTLSRVHVDSVGTGQFDADGVRVDERGDGSIFFRARHSIFENVGADGIELDEGDDGDVSIAAQWLTLKANGHYCAAITDLENPEDPTCVEDDDGELVLDLDDGFDIDEAGPGSIVGQIGNSALSFNMDEGLDFDEEGPGGFDIKVQRVAAFGNADEGIKMSEADEGDLVAYLRRVVIVDSNDDGAQLEEEGPGTLGITILGSLSTENKKEDFKVTQESVDGDSDGVLELRNTIFDSLELEAVEKL